MRPLLLQGHERAITQIKYNREGDLLFTVAKDKLPNVWFSINGERLGTYNGHQGAVWGIDVDWQSTNVATAAADGTCKIWDCATGTIKYDYIHGPPVRTCNFSYSGNIVLYSTDKAMKAECEVFFRDVRQPVDAGPIRKIEITPKHSKVTSAIWGTLDDTIITGHETGEIILWEFETGEMLSKIRPHSKVVMDLQKSADGNMFISASKDFNAKLFDTDTLRELKVYKTEKPVNSAAISPTKEHILLGGGQEAIDAAIQRGGNFDARFFHLVFEEEFGRVKDHFGPINSVAFHPDGKSYSSGGEDGYVRVHTFDDNYLNFNFEY